MLYFRFFNFLVCFDCTFIAKIAKKQPSGVTFDEVEIDDEMDDDDDQ